jgi:hypothetical protein
MSLADGRTPMPSLMLDFISLDCYVSAEVGPVSGGSKGLSTSPGSGLNLGASGETSGTRMARSTTTGRPGAPAKRTARWPRLRIPRVRRPRSRRRRAATGRGKRQLHGSRRPGVLAMGPHPRPRPATSVAGGSGRIISRRGRGWSLSALMRQIRASVAALNAADLVVQRSSWMAFIAADRGVGPPMQRWRSSSPCVRGGPPTG